MGKNAKKVAKKAVTKPKVWYIDVERDADTCVTREPNSDDDWDRGNTSTHWSVYGLKLVEQDGYKTASVAFEPVKGEMYHLLYAVYSTGDSFGHDEGRNFEVIGVYKDRKVAEENEKRLRSHTDYSDGWDVDLKVEGIKEPHKFHVPWLGYFESLDVLEIRTLVLR